MIKGKRVCVIGAAGSIGSELCRQLYKQNKIFGLDINESSLHDLIVELGINGRVGDIRDKETVHDVFSDFKPQVIFHAAALKHVDVCEKYPSECIRTNVNGTENIISEARKWECVEKFVFISTDKINGETIMGGTKALGERITRNQGKGYVAVRFGNVMGSRGSLIPIWQRQVDKKEPITVTDIRCERYFMSIPEACELVIEAAETGKGGETICLDMGERINILDLAQKIVAQSRQGIPIKITSLKEGEQLSEKLMSVEEESRAIKKGKFYIIK